MHYWLFDGGDVVGPFSGEELLRRPGFGAGSLVCPEKHGDDQSYWKEARAYADFGFGDAPAPARPETPNPATEDKEDVYQQEMSTLLSENNLLNASRPAEDDAKPQEVLHMPPANRTRRGSPIEDYFNNIQGEDLGNILGIPDPRENSDLNLNRALETQFDSDKEVAVTPDPFDEFTAKEEQLPERAESQFQQSELVPAAAAAVAPQQLPTQPAQTSAPVQNPASHKPAAVSSREAGREEGPSLHLNASAALKLADTVRTPVHQTQPATQASEPKPVAAQEPGPQMAVLQDADEQPSAAKLAPAQAQVEELAVVKPRAKQPAPQAISSKSAVPANAISNPAEPSVSAPKTQPAAAPKPAQTQAAATPAPVLQTEHFPARNSSRQAVPAQSEPGDVTSRILAGSVRARETPTLDEPIKDVRISDSSYRTPLAATPEIEEYLSERVVRPSRAKRVAKWGSLLAAGSVAVLAFMMNRTMSPSEAAQPSASPSVRDAAAPSNTPLTLAPLPSAVAASPVPAAETVPTRNPRPIPIPMTPAFQPALTEKAKTIAQNYKLADGGTIDAYFDSIYKTQLEQGYTASWAAEPLHKDMYVVKYRLTKTRKEPVIYIFQVDVSKGRLTGALNNAAIDLVGKIR